jgi:hypothetical protein
MWGLGIAAFLFPFTYVPGHKTQDGSYRMATISKAGPDGVYKPYSGQHEPLTPISSFEFNALRTVSVLPIVGVATAIGLGVGVGKMLWHRRRNRA